MKRKLDLTKREIAAIKRVVEYDAIALPEHDSPDGYFGYDDQLAFVYEQIDAGNEWGWCTVKVVASILVDELADVLQIDADVLAVALGLGDNWSSFAEVTGDDYLGGCSYRSKREFMAPGDYYDDMKITALDDLISQVADVKRKVLSAV